MTPLTEAERKTVADHLSQNKKTCKKCGGSDWEIGEVSVSAADLVGDFAKVPDDGATPYVELTCKSCNEPDSVDCDIAGLDR